VVSRDGLDAIKKPFICHKSKHIFSGRPACRVVTLYWLSYTLSFCSCLGFIEFLCYLQYFVLIGSDLNHFSSQRKRSNDVRRLWKWLLDSCLTDFENYSNLYF
jgi:hypothetical protein